MADTLLNLIDALARRTRDPNSSAATRVLTRTLLGHVHGYVNAHARAKLTTSSFIAVGGQTYYSISSNLPTAMQIVKMQRTSGTAIRDLYYVPWRSLTQTNRAWPQRRGTPRLWSMIGRNLLILHPTPLVTETLQVLYTATTSFASEAVSTTIPDILIPAMLSQVEQILLARQRLFSSIKPAAERVKTQLEVSSS